ncbi:MAG: lysostaphin resistance A-like protein [Thermoplasmatota archaeon]
MSPEGETTEVGTQEQMMADPKWNGVPPVGNNPIRNKWSFLGLILIVFTVKIIIWGIYRYITGTVAPFTDPEIGEQLTYWVGMVAKPILQLGPLAVLWWFLFKEKVSPFRFTRKNLASSLAWGLLGAVLFFVVATTSMTILMTVMGYGSDFRIVAGWDVEGVGWGLIIAMMFSYMIGTGPAEELFSRGFLQDQTARAHPIWFAMGFSAVLFAAGHLPISIFMHHMSAEAIFWYMMVLFVMGMFFSLIYQWSRNILLPILIHGLWDWYLSLFSWKGDWSAGFLANSDVIFLRIDFFNTLITLTIMLPIFYFIYKRFWRKGIYHTGSPFEPRRKDNPLFQWFKDRDQGHWPDRPWMTVIGVTFIFCLLMFPAAWVVGTKDSNLFKDGSMDKLGEPFEVREWNVVLADGYLNQGVTEEVLIPGNDTTITKVNVSLFWNDEADIGFLYTNQPDTFRITLMDGEGNELKSSQGQNSQTDQRRGEVDIVWITDDETRDLGNMTVMITMVRAGAQERMISILGLRDVPDDGNEYGLRVDYETLSIRYANGEESGDVRW